MKLTSHLLLATLLSIAAVAADASEITVLGPGGLRPFGQEVLPVFERSSHHKVTPTWVPGPQVLEKLMGADIVDVAILPSSAADQLVRLVKLREPIKLATSQVGVAVPSGGRRPDISSTETLKQALLDAKAIAYSGGTSGAALTALFERLGIAETIKGKLRQIQGEPVGAALARGEAEIGFQQMGELLPVKGIDVIGPLPSSVEAPLVFAVAVHVATKDPAAAKELVDFLTSPELTTAIKKYGMNPP